MSKHLTKNKHKAADMNYKQLLLLSFFLASCGGSESTSEPKIQPKTVESTKITTVSSQVSPLEHGAKIYKRCKSCHTLEENGRHKVGPNLWNVYGSKAGAKDGFNYSKVMAVSDVIWTQETMDAYIKKPSEFMKGNRMTFIGLKKQKDRDAVQLYIKEQTTP